MLVTVVRHRVLVRIVTGVLVRVGAAAHHLEHPRPAVEQEPGDEKQREGVEGDIQPCGVVPGDASLGDNGVAGVRGQARGSEDHLDGVPGQDHGEIESSGDPQGGLGAVVLAVDQDDRQDDQVGEDKARHPAEADAAVPQDGGDGTFPTEQTKLSSATTGPMIGPQSAARRSFPSKKKARSHSFGIQASIAPAIRSPPAI